MASGTTSSPSTGLVDDVAVVFDATLVSTFGRGGLGTATSDANFRVVGLDGVLEDPSASVFSCGVLGFLSSSSTSDFFDPSSVSEPRSFVDVKLLSSRLDEGICVPRIPAPGTLSTSF